MPSHASSSAGAAGHAQGSERVIKKYPNRRLYDTQASAYVTLADMRALVMQRAPFVVRDARTGEDLTRSILLQIMLEEEAGGAPMFSEQLLANLIRFYGHAMQGLMGAYLERSIDAMMDVQARLAEQAQSLSPENWRAFMQPGVMGGYFEQSQALLAHMQQQMHAQAGQVLGAFGLRPASSTMTPDKNDHDDLPD
jgi:polyhydroxyalkanoate synthesis repressor phaR